jgi:hypothetical protein
MIIILETIIFLSVVTFFLATITGFFEVFLGALCAIGWLLCQACIGIISTLECLWDALTPKSRTAPRSERA